MKEWSQRFHLVVIPLKIKIVNKHWESKSDPESRLIRGDEAGLPSCFNPETRFSPPRVMGHRRNFGICSLGRNDSWVGTPAATKMGSGQSLNYSGRRKRRPYSARAVLDTTPLSSGGSLVIHAPIGVRHTLRAQITRGNPQKPRSKILCLFREGLTLCERKERSREREKSLTSESFKWV